MVPRRTEESYSITVPEAASKKKNRYKNPAINPDRRHAASCITGVQGLKGKVGEDERGRKVGEGRV